MATQKTISRLFRELQTTIISRATHTHCFVSSPRWQATMLEFTAIIYIIKKRSVKRTNESLGHRPICITGERDKGPLNHVQTQIWAAQVRSIQTFATHKHSDDSAGYCNEHRTSTPPCDVSIILQGRRRTTSPCEERSLS